IAFTGLMQVQVQDDATFDATERHSWSEFAVSLTGGSWQISGSGTLYEYPWWTDQYIPVTSMDFGTTTVTCPLGCSGSIGDYVWADWNRDGLQTQGEPGIPGVALTLSGPQSQNTVTGPGGLY